MEINVSREIEEKKEKEVDEGIIKGKTEITETMKSKESTEEITEIEINEEIEQNDLMLELLKITSPLSYEQEFKSYVIKELKRRAELYKYPDYVNAAWIRVPPHKKYLRAWIEKWIPIVLTYAAKKRALRINLEEAINEWPFTDGSVGLTLDILQVIIKEMEKQKLAFLRFPHAYIFWVSLVDLGKIIRRGFEHIGKRIIRTTVFLEIFPDLDSNDIIILLKNLARIGVGTLTEDDLGFRVNL